MPIVEFVGAAERQHAKPSVHMVETPMERYHVKPNMHIACTRWWQKREQGGLPHGGAYSRSIAKVACQEIDDATVTCLQRNLARESAKLQTKGRRYAKRHDSEEVVGQSNEQGRIQFSSILSFSFTSLW